MKESMLLRKLGFFTGLWWVALHERDPWLREWVEGSRARWQLFCYRTATFIAVAGTVARLMSLFGEWEPLRSLYGLASAFGALVLWMRSRSWVTEYRDILESKYD